VDEISAQKSSGFVHIGPVAVELWINRQTSVLSLSYLLLKIARYTRVSRTIKTICSSLPSNKNDLIKSDSLFSHFIIHSYDVKWAVGRLKLHKNDGGSCLSIYNFINTGDDCSTHIAFLLASITVHSTVPNSFYISTIVPIAKVHNDEFV